MDSCIFDYKFNKDGLYEVEQNYEWDDSKWVLKKDARFSSAPPPRPAWLWSLIEALFHYYIPVSTTRIKEIVNHEIYGKHK